MVGDVSGDESLDEVSIHLFNWVVDKGDSVLCPIVVVDGAWNQLRAELQIGAWLTNGGHFAGESGFLRLVPR